MSEAEKEREAERNSPGTKAKWKTSIYEDISREEWNRRAYAMSE
jgi:hypothetical protein